MRWSSPQFVHLLWGVLVLGLLWLHAERARRLTELSLGEPPALRALSGEAGPRARAVRVLLVLSALAFLVLGGIALQRNLLIAISSNLTLICVGLLLFSWHHWNGLGQVRAASLATVHVPTGNDLCLFALLLLGCVVSFVTSHFFYVRHLRDFMSTHAAPRLLS